MTSQYEKDLAELKRRGTALAKEFIPKLYEDLRKEHLEPSDARERIERDCADLWSKATIREYLPDEAKNKEAQDKGRKGNATKSEKLTKARMDLAENGSVCQKEEESRKKINAITIGTSGGSAYVQERRGGDDKSQPTLESDQPKQSNKDLRQQEELLIKPYECKTDLEIKDQVIPIVVYCDPQRKTATVKVDIERVGSDELV
jgi:hypothetical protein